ncbi:hypothetical protein Ddc_11311 [Ditylenchus destructor]|nr:hypothetical protein Ddc_11311 [Ditylenchus destructor]
MIFCSFYSSAAGFLLMLTFGSIVAPHWRDYHKPKSEAPLRDSAKAATSSEEHRSDETKVGTGVVAPREEFHILKILYRILYGNPPIMR